MSNKPGFNHPKAASLLFSEKNIASGIKAVFREDRILFYTGWDNQLVRLIQFYQEAFLREKITDQKWLEGKVSAISEMCSLGCTPFINLDPRSAGDLPARNLHIPLKWLNQSLELTYCQTIDGQRYYEARVTSSEQLHGFGNKILWNLMFEDNDLKYALGPEFESISYTDRLSLMIRNKEDEANYLQKVKDAVSPIVSEVFKVFGESKSPEFSQEKIPSMRAMLLKTCLNKTDSKSGSVNSTISIETSVSDNHETIHLEVTFDLADNQFALNNRALSQMQGIEAMNLFVIRLDQLKREIALP